MEATQHEKIDPDVIDAVLAAAAESGPCELELTSAGAIYLVLILTVGRRSRCWDPQTAAERGVLACVDRIRGDLLRQCATWLDQTDAAAAAECRRMAGTLDLPDLSHDRAIGLLILGDDSRRYRASWSLYEITALCLVADAASIGAVPHGSVEAVRRALREQRKKLSVRLLARLSPATKVQLAANGLCETIGSIIQHFGDDRLRASAASASPTTSH